MIKENQREYIKQFAFKKTNDEIARELNINEKTVRNWKKKIYGYVVKNYSDFYRIKNEILPIELDREKWVYLAGFIDGEGCLFLDKNSSRTNNKYMLMTPKISISNTNEEVINFCKESFKSGGIYKTNSNPHIHSNNKQIFLYVKQGFGILPILVGILPFLRVKRERAILLIEYIKIRLKQNWREPYTKRHYEIYDEIKKLNKRGIK